MPVTHAHVTHGTSGRKDEMMSSVTGGEIFGREREVFGRGEGRGGLATFRSDHFSSLLPGKKVDFGFFSVIFLFFSLFFGVENKLCAGFVVEPRFSIQRRR